MALLETMTPDELRHPGVAVFPHVLMDVQPVAIDTTVALAQQLAQLTDEQLAAIARRLAQTDAMRAGMFAEALWSEALDAEHARLQADDAVMERCQLALAGSVT